MPAKLYLGSLTGEKAPAYVWLYEGPDQFNLVSDTYSAPLEMVQDCIKTFPDLMNESDYEIVTTEKIRDILTLEIRDN